MPIATIGGRAVYYEVHGEQGDPAVLIHGSLSDHHVWDLVVPGLAQGFQLLRYDRRGHGRSAPGLRPHPVADDAADLAGLLEATDRFPAHLIAHSYGGVVAFHLAAHRPDLVRSIAVHEPPSLGMLSRDGPHAAEGARAVAEIRELEALVRQGHPEDAVRRFLEAFSLGEGAWRRLPPEERDAVLSYAGAWVEEFDDPETFQPDLTALSELLMPVLLTSGEESPEVLRYVSEAIAAVVPYPEVLRLPECGHVPQLTKPDLYVGVLGTFLLERNVPPT
jgi:pimeloyl-ACP methyl ester carboxylesterase